MRLINLKRKKIINRVGLAALAVVIILFAVSFFPIRLKGDLATRKVGGWKAVNYEEVDIADENIETQNQEIEDKGEEEYEKIEDDKDDKENEDVLFFSNGLPELSVEKDKSNQNEVVQSMKINRLIIPKINVEIDIIEGEDEESALLRGAWLLPMTSSPDVGGNTVIAGHRYFHKPPSPETFWDLDKLEAGDEFKIIWKGKVYNYNIKETKIVEPDDVSILYNTAKPMATLFTCTPLYTSKQRLVVVGNLVK